MKVIFWERCFRTSKCAQILALNFILMFTVSEEKQNSSRLVVHFKRSKGIQTVLKGVSQYSMNGRKKSNYLLVCR